MTRKTLLAVGSLSLLVLASSGCKKNEGATGDGGATDAAVASADAGAAPLAEPSNEATTARFGDETKLEDVSAKIADAHAVARNSVPGGTVVAPLKMNEEVVQIAQHGRFILCTFPDPKDPTKRLEGWIAEEAFKAGPTPALPKGATCTGTQVHLVSDETVFCGNVCKEDKDCPADRPKCAGHANTYIDNKEGPAVTTCTVAPGTDAGAPSPSPTPTPAGNTQAGVQVPPLANGTCLTGFVIATDKLCHKTCPKVTDCPAGARCTKKMTADATPVCEIAGH